jgi:serine/threonine protein kinase
MLEPLTMGFQPLPGSEVAGYRILSEVGRGGSATVYLAEHPGLGRRVALKILRPEFALDETFRARFSREARIAAGLEHPNVLPVYDAGEWEGLLYIAMRYVDGTDLAGVLSREGFLSLSRTLGLAVQVAAALDAAHAGGLVHRDVKPGNVLVAPGAGPGGSEHVYLADFGIARPVLGVSALTAAGEMYGTVDYMAPEQLTGGVVDARTDVYAFSCLVYECLTGVQPFRRSTIVATAAAHLNEEPKPPSALRPDLPPGLDLAILKGMAKTKDARPSTATALLDSGTWAPTVARARIPLRRKLFAALGIVASIVTLIVAAVLAIGALMRPGGSDPSNSPTSPGPGSSPTGSTGPPSAAPGFVLLRDGFSPEVADRWLATPEGPVRWTYTDGHYQVAVDDPTYRWFFSDTSFDPNLRNLPALGVQVDVVRITGAGRAGLICRSKGNQSNSFYGAYVTKSGRYGFDKVDGAIIHLSRGTVVGVDVGNAIHLRLDCTEESTGGVRLTLWANGHFVDDLLDTNTPLLGPGSVGVFFSSGRRPAGAAFDNFVIRDLSG